MSTIETTVDEWVFPAATDPNEWTISRAVNLELILPERVEPDDETDEWLDCGHPPEHADEDGQCVVCNVTQTTERDRASKADLTRDQAASSPFDGGVR